MSEICSRLEYLPKPKDSLVVKYGDKGDLFYIILRGRVSVWVPV